MTEPRTSSPERFARADLILLLVAALIVIGFRLHAYPAPLESDECNYAYFAGRLLEGDRLYVDLWDHQPPGIFAVLVLPTVVFGSSPAVYRTSALVLVLLTMLGVFDVARRWFGRPAAWTAALLFAVASSDPGVGGEGCNREIYMNVLLVGAFWTLSRDGGVSLRRTFTAGLLIGLASAIKTVVALHWLALLPAVLLMPAPQAAGKQRHLFRSIASFAAGPAAVWSVIFVYFVADGRFGAFLDATFIQSLIYSGSGEGWAQRLLAFFLKSDGFRTGVFGTAPALWLAGAFGLAAFPWRRDRIRSALMAGWMLGSYFAICMPGKFWPHYYLLMLPPAVLSAAGLMHRIEPHHRTLSLGTALVILFALLATQIPGYLLVEPDRIAWDRYRDRMVWARDQASRVAEITDPDDTIYVWSFDANFYYYSGRRCASRFTMNGALLGEGKSAYAYRQVLLKDLIRNKPRLILIPFSRQVPCPELLRFVQEHKYVSVGRTKRMEVLADLERPIVRIDWTWPPP